MARKLAATLLQVQLKRLIVVNGTIVGCELNSPFAYLYHQRRGTIPSNCNIKKFDMSLLRGIQQKLPPEGLSGCFIVLARYLEKVEGKGLNSGRLFG